MPIQRPTLNVTMIQLYKGHLPGNLGLLFVALIEQDLTITFTPNGGETVELDFIQEAVDLAMADDTIEERLKYCANLNLIVAKRLTEATKTKDPVIAAPEKPAKAFGTAITPKNIHLLPDSLSDERKAEIRRSVGLN